MQPHCKGTQGYHTNLTFAKRLQVHNFNSSNIIGRLTDEKETQPPTWGLALLGQDIVIFIISNMAAVVRAGQTSVGILSYLHHQQSIGIGSGRTFLKSPNNAKPYRWTAILVDTSKLNNMNKYLLGFILTLTIISCKKDDVAINPKEEDYTAFLATTSQTFRGDLDGTNFSWSFGWNQFQGMAGYENGNGICDSIDPVRVVLFGLISEGSGQTRFTLYSPKYNSTSEAEFSKVFSLGKKKLGDFRTDFYLSINKDNKFYQSNSLNQANEIEILKTQEFTDYLGKKLRVWFRINAKLSSCSCQNNNSVLSGGLMLAEFFGFKKIQ